jgi:hypothetical protein
MRKCRVGFVMFLLLFTTIGCSVQHSVHTSATSSLSTELKDEFPTVLSIQYTFTRPDLSIYVETSEVPSEVIMISILERAKRFATVDHINEVARSVKWKDVIWRVNLVFYNDSKNKPAAIYTTSYFKTSSDTSKENIDGYVTWRKQLEPI